MDLGRSNLIYDYKMTSALLKFYINAVHDVANTPASMKLWNYADTGKCMMCGWRKCDINDNKWVNWRHDNVLREIVGTLQGQLNIYKSLEDKVKEEAWLSFKSSSSTYRRPSYKIKRESSFDNARDWKLTWDEDKYPQEFLRTSAAHQNVRTLWFGQTRSTKSLF